MRLNGLGVAMYLLLTGWLLLASVVRVMIEVGAGNVDWLPFVGIALALLALAGIGFGRVTEPADERRPARPPASQRQAAPRSGQPAPDSTDAVPRDSVDHFGQQR